MASSSDGMPILTQMSDFSTIANPLSSAGDMKFYLQTLLDSKEKQLQQAGTLGQRVLAQQMELEERIRQLQEIEADKSDDDEIDTQAREKYRELADTLVTWDAENAQLSSVFGGSKRFANGKAPSPSVTFTELPREEPERSKTSVGASAAQSRRAKNAAHRADDVEFAFEIGSGLLTEVRRLQSLLGERDKAIQDMKEEKDDLEKTVENLRTALRQQEQSADKFKEENWNLEVTLQELRTQLGDIQASNQRLESEQKRLTRQLAAARDAGDQHKNEAERLQNVIEEMKAKHETDIAHARKHAAGLARDKSDLQQSLDAMKAEAARAARRFPRYGSPLTLNGAAGSDFIVTPAGGDDKDSDIFTGGASTNRRKLDTSAIFNGLDGELGSDYADSPEPSPVKQPFLAANHPSNEIEALQQRLAHAQRQINTLKGSLQREKQLKMEYRSRLQASPVAAAADELDIVEVDEAEEAEGVSASKPRRRLTPFKVGGRSGGAGRGRSSRANMSLIEKLGMAAHSPGSEYPDDDDQDDDEPPPVPPIPIKFSQAEEDEDDPFASKIHSQDVEDEEAKEEISRSPSPLEPPSNRTSIDGMDPAFANVLRRVPSNGSSYATSPLRQSVLGSAHGRRSVGRRPRGGVPYKEARPPSLVGPPGVLSAELGVGIEGSPLKNRELLEDVQEKAYQDVETFEVGCQTDEVPESAPMTAVETAEMGVQAEPVVEPVPEVVTSEQSMQTEAEAVIVVEKADMATQSEVEVAVRPALVNVNIGTEPVPAPILIQTEIQTQSVSLVGAGIQTDLPSFRDEQVSRRTTITQHDVSFGHSSGDTTVTRRDFLVEAAESDYEEEDGDETETGAETETDMDDYQDARQSISMFSPSGTESRDDFHSVLTMTDNDFSESEDDGESIKASRLSSTHHLNSSVASSVGLQQDRPSSYYAALAPPAKEYEDVGVSADFQPEPERIVERVVERVVVKEVVEVPAPPPPKSETSEISIQTDEWIPPLPPPPPVPPAPPAPITVSTSVQTMPVLTLPSGSTPGLYRVGSSGQQFQFIPPSTPSATSSGPGPASPALSAPISISAPSSNVLRDSGVNLSRTRTAASDRRPSIESAMSATEERPRVSSAAGLLAAVDKSKPPTMIVPPPPRLPPPTNMPPPSFIPERRIPTSSTGSYDIPPPRPSSPPPPELVQRATTPTPTFGSVLNVPGGKAMHSLRHGASMPASPSAGIRQPPSTSSFRSATPLHGPHSMASSGNLQSLNVVRERRQFSTTSLVSERSVPSPRSSMSSEQVPYHNAIGPEPSTPNKTADITPRATGTSTDPAVIHAITQTMIGEFLYKYTRRAIGKGHGERRHRRFFWVHPYTKTLYWSSADPTSTNVSESSAKSAYIEGVRSVLDPNPMPPGLYQHSVIISTPQREMKITAPTKERHDIWFNALKYLLSRPTAATMTSPGNATVVPQSPASGGDFTDDERRHVGSSPQSQRSGRSLRNTDTWNVTPRGQRSRSQLSVGGSVGKRSGTPAAEYLRWNGPESPYSPTKSFVEVANRDDEELDFELHDNSLSDDGFEGLENVRACCDGRHTVGHHHHHHHHHHADQFQPLDNLHLEPARQESVPIRPVSPSAWSFRSRTGSAHSHEGGGGGIFGWGRGEDGKLRFGSRRSTKTALVNDQ